MKTAKESVFDAQAFLDSTGVARKIVEHQKNGTIFTQGDASKYVMYIQKGHVKLSVVSKTGKEGVVAMLKPGDFVGEGALAGRDPVPQAVDGLPDQLCNGWVGHSGVVPPNAPGG